MHLLEKLQKKSKHTKFFIMVFLCIIFCVLFLGYSMALPLKIKLGMSEKFPINLTGIFKVEFKQPVSSTFTIQNAKQGVVIVPTSIGTGNMELNLLGIVKLKDIEVNVVNEIKLRAIGRAVGVRMFTNGLLVESVGDVEGVDGKIYTPAIDAGLRAGDIILKANDTILNSVQDLVNILDNSGNKVIMIESKRKDKITKMPIRATFAIDKRFHIGIYLRDSISGIGTITFVNDDTKRFGALGHGISDNADSDILPISGGEIFETEILSIRKGEKGTPGELKGNLYMDYNVLGDIKENHENGIFGIVKGSPIKFFGTEYNIGYKETVKEGDAYILSNIEGSKVERFKIQIQKIIGKTFNSPKGMIVKIVDERLLAKTGGIVQGMSGSPIVQNGRIIGAVTHVLINDPQKGYGIFIESMLEPAQ